ncbi:MAG: VCBS repeat-containing protein, partial [Chitinophagaceae bacterium]|nr:VCBS repeat-containing protein [Chitinophagaceae bacterium]
SGTYAATAALFRNNGDNTFTRINIPGMPNAGRGSCAITDINGDGRPDITYSASVNLTPAGAVCKIYLNNGSFSFTELTNNLPGLMASSMDWFDYDTDGDPDLVMNGYNASGSLSGLYKNNGGGAFTSVSMPPFFATSSGMVQWVDANGDGRMDFINTGVTTPGNVNGIVPELLINNGGDNFTRLITNMPARAISFIDGYDYDRDGDADFVYSGLIPSTPNTDVAVYKNNGGGNFTRVAYRTGVQCLSTVKWIDLNLDNRKDLFVCGRTENNPSYVLMNMDADSFRLASYPFVSYTNTSGQNVLVEDLNNDGLPDFMFAGPLDDQDCAEGNSSALILSEGWKRKPFTGFTNVFDFRSIPSSAVTANSFWRWGDVDNDGKKDVILTKNNEPLRVFKNNGGNNFSLLYSGRINNAKSYDQCGVVDIDNDGTNELYVMPNKLYKWNGSSFTTLYEATGIGCEGQLLITCDGYFDFGDYNKDGFTDVVFVQGGFVYVLRNNGTGRFVNDYPSYLDALGTPDASA